MAVKDNLLELEVVYSKLNKALDENISRLNTGATAVENYNKKISVVPSEFQKSLTDIKTKTDAVTLSNEKLVQAKTKVNAKTSEEIVNGRALAQASDRQAKATSNVVGAYARLNAQYQIAEKRLLDLKSSQNASNREIKVAQREFDVLRKRVLAADNAVGRWNKTGERTISGFKNLLGAFGVAGGIYMFANLTMETVKLIKELQGLNLALQQVSGSEFSNNLEFITKTAEDNGVRINDLTRQYTQFYVSAKDKLSSIEIQNIFRSITKAGSTMGLSVQQQERAFLALNQMMSKGTIQAEELRGQLGEALPGAFTIMAKAVGVTEQRLTGMMKAGELLASDVLPRFAKQLEKTYGIETINRVETLTASTNRLSNAWTSLVGSIDSGNGVISRTLNFFISKMTSLLDLFKEGNKTFLDLQKEIGSDIKKSTKEFVFEYAKGVADAEEKRIGSAKNRVETIRKIEEKEAKRRLNAERFNLLEARKKLVSYESVYNERMSAGVGMVLPALRKEKDVQIIRRYEDALLDVSNTEQRIIALQEILGGETQNVTKKTEENTIAINKKTKAQEKQNEILKIGTEKWIKDQISQLEDLRSTNDTTSESYELSTKTIEFYNQWLERLRGTTKATTDDTEGLSLSLKDLADDAAQVEGSFDELNALTFFDDFKQSFVSDFTSQTGFGKMFDLLATDLDKFKGDAVATALVISDAFQEAFNTIANANQRNFDKEYELNELRYTNALKFANGNAEAEEALLKEKERREKEIAIREAKAQKKLAMFNIAINGAQAITATLGKTGFAGIPLAAIVGTLVAAQLALVASQEIPEYWKGTDNAPEGWAKTNERGAEIHTDSKGNIKDFGTNKGTQVKYLSKGDKIINATKTKELLSLSSFNKEYNDMLFRNQILPPIMMNNANNIDLSGVESKLDKLVNKSEVTIVDDENGRRYYEKKNNATMELKNSRIYLKSRNVRG